MRPRRAKKGATLMETAEKGAGYWPDASLVEPFDPEKDEEKMETFQERNDGEKAAVCRKCGTTISAHNRDWHDGCCDGCFFAEGEA